MHKSTRLTLLRIVLLTIVGLVTTQTQLASAQVNAGALVLQNPIITRATAMGETGVADNSDPANIYFNPANVVGRPGIHVQGSRWKYKIFSDDLWAGAGSVGVSFNVGEGTQATTLSADVSYGRLDYGPVLVGGPGGELLGEYDASEDYIALTLGAGFDFDDRWSLRVGAAGKRYSPDFPPAEFNEDNISVSDTYCFDLGVTGALLMEMTGWDITPALAVALVNTGEDVEVINASDDPLPTRVHYGASVRVESPTTTIFSAAVPVIAMVYNVDVTERWHGDRLSFGVGGEFALAQMLFVRAGMSDFEEVGSSNSRDRSGWGLGVGLPIASFRARFDYTRTTLIYQDDHFGFAVDWLF